MKLAKILKSSIYLLLGYLTLVGAAAPVLAAQQANQTVAEPSAGKQSSASDNAGKPLITIQGLCDHSAAVAKVECKTVITRGQFETVINAVDPGMSKYDRRGFAQSYADGLVLAAKAQQMGLDKSAIFEERMRYARIEVLSQILKKKIARESDNISDKDFEDFYHKNIARFEKAEFERIYLPRELKSPLAASDKPPDAGGEDRSQESEQARRSEAEDLHGRALKGEAFAALQADAYAAAGIKSSPPGTALSVRRIALPPDQASVLDLKPGEVSGVLVNTNGYFIYKLKSKETLPLEQVRDEIREALRTQRLQDTMDDVLDATPVTFDKSYFAP